MMIRQIVYDENHNLYHDNPNPKDDNHNMDAIACMMLTGFVWLYTMK